MKNITIFTLIMMSFASFANDTIAVKLFSITLPTNIKAIEARYGLPAKVELPETDDPSPWGQWFVWEFNSSGIMLSALADNYTQTPDHTASVRVIQLESIKPTATPALLPGITFNQSSCDDIKNKLNKHFKQSRRYSIKYFDDSIWTYFDCNNKNGLLSQVLQSTFDLDNAD